MFGIGVPKKCPAAVEFYMPAVEAVVRDVQQAPLFGVTTPLPHLYHTVTRHQEILGETMRAVGNPRLDLAHEFDHVFWIGDLNCKLL